MISLDLTASAQLVARLVFAEAFGYHMPVMALMCRACACTCPVRRLHKSAPCLGACISRPFYRRRISSKHRIPARTERGTDNQQMASNRSVQSKDRPRIARVCDTKKSTLRMASIRSSSAPFCTLHVLTVRPLKTLQIDPRSRSGKVSGQALSVEAQAFPNSVPAYCDTCWLTVQQKRVISGSHRRP